MFSEAHIEHLLVAVLAVGQYPLDRARSIRPGLRAEGLTDAARVADMDQTELAAALERAGYRRGRLTSIYVPRVHQLMKAIRSGQLDAALEHVKAGDRNKFVNKLQEVYGVGPRVASNAWELFVDARIE